MATRNDLGFLGYDHVDLKVRNRPELVRFLVEKLGMEVIGGGDDHDFVMFHDEVLGLHDSTAHDAIPAIDHLALRVARWDGLRAQLEKDGVVVSGEKTRDDSRSLFIEAPGGLRLELICRPHPEHHPPPHRM